MRNYGSPSALRLCTGAAVLVAMVGGSAHAARPAPTVTCTDETTTVAFKGNPQNVHIEWSDEQRINLGVARDEDPAGGVHEITTATPEGAAFVSAFVVYPSRRNISIEAACTVAP